MAVVLRLACVIPTLVRVTPPLFVSPCPCSCLLTLCITPPSFASPHPHSHLSALVCVSPPLFASPPPSLCVVRPPVCTVASLSFVVSTAPTAAAAIAVSVSVAVAAAVRAPTLAINVPLVRVWLFCALPLFLL